jgi:hypothetical protein
MNVRFQTACVLLLIVATNSGCLPVGMATGPGPVGNPREITNTATAYCAATPDHTTCRVEVSGKSVEFSCDGPMEGCSTRLHEQLDGKVSRWLFDVQNRETAGGELVVRCIDPLDTVPKTTTQTGLLCGDALKHYKLVSSTGDLTNGVSPGLLVSSFETSQHGSFRMKADQLGGTLSQVFCHTDAAPEAEVVLEVSQMSTVFPKPSAGTESSESTRIEGGEAYRANTSISIGGLLVFYRWHIEGKELCRSCGAAHDIAEGLGRALDGAYALRASNRISAIYLAFWKRLRGEDYSPTLQCVPNPSDSM